MADLTTKPIFTLGDSIYLLSASGTWGTAQAEALSFGGNLATINNAAEQTFLAGLFAGQNLWIGYNDAGTEGSFQWINGENSAYTHWSGGEPNNLGGQDFAILGSSGNWDDRRGGEDYKGIIEIKNPTTPILVIEDLGIIEPYATTKQVAFKVKRFGSSNSSATVSYNTADGTTVAGGDYLATNGTLTFNSGETEKTISVTVNRDTDVTSGETFFVNLSSPSNAILGNNQAKATIREAPEAVTFKGKTYLLTNPGNWGEAQQQARAFGGNLVTINSAEEQTFLAGVYAGQDVWIGYSDAGKERSVTTGEGFQWVSGESSAYTKWAGGEPNNLGGQDFAILGSSGNWDDRRGGEDYKGIVEIPLIPEPLTDLSQRQIYTFGDSIYLLTATAKNWGEAQVEAQNFQGNLTTINDGAEQTFLAGLFAGKDLWTGYSDAGVEGTFQWANGENSAYTNWGFNEPNNLGGQDFAILGSSGNWDDRRGGEDYKGIIEIKNPTTPILVIEDLGIIEPTGGVRQAIFTVQRYGNSSASTTVNYSTANGTTVAGGDYTAISGTLTFNPGETKKTISVTVAQDADAVSEETFFVNLTSPNNAVLGDSQAKATIREATETVTFGNSTYLLTTSSNWGEAQQQARAFGGNLVTINSAEEQAFLAGKYAGQNLWIGYSDAGKEYNITTREGFQWVSRESSAYTNWAGGEPNNLGGQDFAILGSNGRWDDRSGSDSYKGIIEIPNAAIPPVVPVINLPRPLGNQILQGDAGNNTLVGSVGNDQLFGNAGQDSLNGVAGDDLLCGGAGVDVLIGGTGRDRFLFDLEKKFIKSQMGLDQITDFTKGDKIVLDRTTFVQLKQLSFASVKNTSQAKTSEASITYIRSTGALFYNQNGSSGGFGTGGLFADLVNGLNLGKSDLAVVK